MEALIPLALFVVVGVLVVVAIVATQRYEKQRSENIQKIAAQLGLPYHRQAAPEVLEELAGFKLFSKGHSRTITNMLYGEADGVKLALFDYRYTVGSGKNQSTLKQSVAYVRASELDATPQFALAPENFFHRIGEFLGMQDIDFDEHPNFSKAFLLRGPNEEAIRQFFTPERIAFIEKHPHISIEARNGQLAVFHAGIRSEPEKLQDLMNIGFETYRLFSD